MPNKKKNSPQKSPKKRQKNNNIVFKSTSIVQKKKKSKVKKNNEKQYSIDDMVLAMTAIDDGMSLTQAARKFKVPKSTLSHKVRNLTPIECKKGPSTVLSYNVENEVVSWILSCAERGFPITKNQLLDCVQNYLNFEKKKSPFKNNRPGKHWYHAFMRRHPCLTQRIAQNLTTSRASVSESDLRSWFSQVKSYLEKKDLLLDDSSRIFNLDESAFMMVPKDNTVLTEKGAKAVYQIVSGNEKACLTVLVTVAASGSMAPPMILFDCKTVPRRNVLDNIPTGWGVGYTDSGWMTAESFYNYIKNIFLKWLKKRNCTFPVILYVDGHSSHCNLPLMKFCKENQIELILLYPNSTHIIQPLDVALFRPLKDSYKKALRQWRIDNNVVNVKKWMFAPVLKSAIDAVDFSITIQNGFRACGLYPFNADNVDYNILNKTKKRKDTQLNKVALDTNNQNTCEENNSDDNSKMLTLFETQLISQSTLQLFKRDELAQSWSGEIEKKELFESWRKLKQLCDSSSAQEKSMNCDGTANNNIFACTDNSVIIEDVILENINDEIIEEILINTGTDNSFENNRDRLQPNLSHSSHVEHETDIFVNLSSGTIELVDESGQKQIATIIASKPSNDTSDNCNELHNDESFNDTLNFPDETLAVSLRNETIQLQSTELSNDYSVGVDDPNNNKSIMDNNIVAPSFNNLNECQDILDLSLNSNKAHLTDSDQRTCTTINISTNGNMKVITKNDDSGPCNLPLTEPNKNSNQLYSPIDQSKITNDVSKNKSKISDNFEKAFEKPIFNSKKKNKDNSRKEVTKSCYIVDDLIDILEKKESEKKLKEEEIQKAKEERDKLKIIKEKEQSVQKEFSEKKKYLLQRKKNLKSEIASLKKLIKSTNVREDVIQLKKQLNDFVTELNELDKFILVHDMSALQEKMKIKLETA